MAHATVTMQSQDRVQAINDFANVLSEACSSLRNLPHKIQGSSDNVCSLPGSQFDASFTQITGVRDAAVSDVSETMAHLARLLNQTRNEASRRAISDKIAELAYMRANVAASAYAVWLAR